MKELLSLMSSLLLLMTTGCGTVAYRLNPDSPPRMSVSEAIDAVELSMSLSRGYMDRKVVVREDVIDIGSVSGMVRFKLYYDNIEP